MENSDDISASNKGTIEVQHSESFEVIDLVHKDKEHISENVAATPTVVNDCEVTIVPGLINPADSSILIPETETSDEYESLQIPPDAVEANKSTENLISGTELHFARESTERKISSKEISELPSSSNDDILPSLGILPEEEVPSACILERKNRSFEDTNAPLLEGNSDLDNSRICNTKTLLPSEVSHKEKRIKWKDIEVSIITQNNNGPCPLLAILNAMILKGSITLPRDRQELTGGELVSIVANAVFDVPRSSVPSEMHRYLEQNSQDAVDILDKLLTGLDVNIKFSGVKDFEFTPGLSVFDVLGISLYHGWVIDPKHEAASLVSNMSYNQLTTNIIFWREQATFKQDDSLLVNALLCEQFIENSVSQLTYYGLYQLGATLAEEEIAVLFRNNHFATIYKREGSLYLLLTDQGYLHTSAVWETLTDVDSTFSEFVNGDFQPIQSCEPCQKEAAVMTTEQQINSDLELATMLQEEDQKTRQREEGVNKMLTDLGLKDLSDEEIARRLQERENQLAEEASRALEEEQQHHEQHGTASSRTTQSSRMSPQPRLSKDHQEKKKKDCVIL